MAGPTTSQQFRIRDIPGQAEPVVAAGAAQAQRQQLRARYEQLIEQFSAPTERGSEEVRFAHRRYAKIMAMDPVHPLRAALSMLEQRQQLTAAEVTAIIVGAERGDVEAGKVQALIENPQQLPAAGIADAVRSHVLRSTSEHLQALRRSLTTAP